MKTSDSLSQQKRLATSYEVKPTKTLLFASMPCEKRAASVKQGTLSAMHNADTESVAFRYMQCKKGTKESNNEIIDSLVMSGFAIMFLYSNKSEINNESVNLFHVFCYLALILNLLSIMPAVQNRLIYHDMSNKSLDCLKKNLDEQKLKEVTSCDYDNAQSIRQLHGFFKQSGETYPQNLPSKVSKILRQEV